MIVEGSDTEIFLACRLSGKGLALTNAKLPPKRRISAVVNMLLLVMLPQRYNASKFACLCYYNGIASRRIL